MEIRRLTTADAAAYQALRLKGLCEEPTAFASSYEEERAYPLSKYEEWLGVPPDRGAIGAFDGEELVGIVTLGRESHRHLAHKALIMGMYVRGDRQGRGIGRMLLQQVIDLARSVAEIRQVNIIANAANAPAQKLYESLGFRAYGRELR
ncbi:MAG TPA: GNAT family N-acetyltransferase, partial [Rhodanobacteraceae bacterium]